MLLPFIICVLQFHRASPQFPDHVDLQKLSEVDLNGEKYNLLKVSTHMVRDHFNDFMQRRNSDIPTKRVFMDKNGFRHYWSGFEDQKSLRRDNDVNVVTAGNTKNDTVTTEKATEDQVDNKTKILNETGEVFDNKTKVEDDKVQVNNNITTAVPVNNTVANGNKKVKKHKRKGKLSKVKPALRKGKTMLFTRFYCPYFGVMTLTSIVDT